LSLFLLTGGIFLYHFDLDFNVFRSLVRISLTVSVFIFAFSAIFLQSLMIISHHLSYILLTFESVLEVAGCLQVLS
jgi:hypothetical protein